MEFDIDLIESTEKEIEHKKEILPSTNIQNFSLSISEKVELDGRIQYFKLQKLWSYSILVWISAIILFHMALTSFIGLGILNFEKSPNFLTGILIENFLQIAGMGWVVVKFLHSSKK